MQNAYPFHAIRVRRHRMMLKLPTQVHMHHAPKHAIPKLQYSISLIQMTSMHAADRPIFMHILCTSVRFSRCRLRCGRTFLIFWYSEMYSLLPHNWRDNNLHGIGNLHSRGYTGRPIKSRILPPALLPSAGILKRGSYTSLTLSLRHLLISSPISSSCLPIHFFSRLSWPGFDSSFREPLPSSPEF